MSNGHFGIVKGAIKTILFTLLTDEKNTSYYDSILIILKKLVY